MPALDIETGPSPWERPLPCRHCANPVAKSAQVCPHCLGATRLWSKANLRTGLGRAQRVVLRLITAIAFCLLAGLALTLGYLLSPLLLLFPLVLVCSRPPASRGGKTVTRGRAR